MRKSQCSGCPIITGLRSTAMILILSAMLISCDRWIVMGYAVKNNTGHEVTLFVPNYSDYSSGRQKDTTLTIQASETLIMSGIRIMHPSKRGFYRNNPGVCGIKRLENDTSIELGCSKKEWKYRKGRSLMILK